MQQYSYCQHRHLDAILGLHILLEVPTGLTNELKRKHMQLLSQLATNSESKLSVSTLHAFTAFPKKEMKRQKLCCEALFTV